VRVEPAMTKASRLSLAAALSALFVPSAAVAQTTHERCVAANGCTYVFVDDPLDAHGFGANDVLLRVAPHAIRTALVRPRTSFVTEMLESVEKM